MKLSVIIPVYNQEKLVVRCLDSIPKRKDIEIIVVNDGSTDNTLKSLEEYKKKYKKLIIINCEENLGVSNARNLGLDIAQGEYVIFIDSDDYVDTKVFKEILNTELNVVDLVFYNMIDNNGELYIVDKHRTRNRVGMFKFIRRAFIGDTRFIVGVQRGEDAIFHDALICKCPSFTCTNKLMYHYNFPRKGSLTDLYKGVGKDDYKSIN